jgi:hypothetical protein
MRHLLRGQDCPGGGSDVLERIVQAVEWFLSEAADRKPAPRLQKCRVNMLGLSPLSGQSLLH